MSRPYKITPTLAMDLDNILSIEMIESPNKKGTYQIIICMLYIDPIVLDFPNVMAARTKFSEIFEEWKSTKLSENTEAHIRKLVCSEVNELLHVLDEEEYDETIDRNYDFHINGNKISANDVKEITADKDYNLVLVFKDGTRQVIVKDYSNYMSVNYFYKQHKMDNPDSIPLSTMAMALLMDYLESNSSSVEYEGE